MVRIGIILTLALAVAANATEGSYEAFLAVRPAKGKVDDATQTGFLKIKNWSYRLISDSDGIDLMNEPIVVSIGSGETTNQFPLPVGSLEVSRNGKRYRYRSDAETGIQRLKIKERKDGTWRVSMTVAGIVMERLVQETSVCEFLSFEIGNDEAFVGIRLERKRPTSRRVRLRGFCTPDVCLGSAARASAGAWIGQDGPVHAAHGICPTIR